MAAIAAIAIAAMIVAIAMIAAAKAATPVVAKEKPSILEALKHGAEKSKALFGGKAEPDKKPEISI